MRLLKALFKIMRPTQWIKNAFVFMPLIFSARLRNVEDITGVTGMFVAFCLASSATYVLNDYLDMEQDKIHPLKRNRPLARGDITPTQGLVLMCLLTVGVFFTAAVMRAPLICFVLLAAYLVLQTVYSLMLKNIVILDVLSISIGFLLRVVVGGRPW